MKKHLMLLFWLAITVTTQVLWAGSTGKIMGRVTDATTGKPLVGVNVFINELNLGAAADLDGQFYILNVPVGIYTVQAQYIGYSGMEITEVKVNADLTTPLDIELSSEIIQSSETVVVVAKRALVQKDLTASRRTLTSDDLADMPVASVEGAVSLSAGAVNDGGLHLRGGRATEVVYLFDGIALNDPLTGNPNDADVPIMAVDEANILSGGFGAEYGNAQSGVINIVSSEGRQNFAGKLRYTTSAIVADAFTGIDPHERQKLEFNGSIPLFSSRMNLVIAGEVNESYGRFSNQYSDLNNYTAKFTYKLNEAIKFKFSGLYTKSISQWGYSHGYSHTIQEDRMRSYMPRYLEEFDGSTGDFTDGMLTDEEIPEYFRSWFTTPGLQTEDLNGNGVLDDGEDQNDNNKIDSEGILDHWYGNGVLNTEDINFNGILDPNEDLNGNGILDSEDADRDSSLTNYNMAERLPWTQRSSNLIMGGWTHSLSAKTFYEVKIARYETGLDNNIIERVNEDRNYNHQLDEGEDLNGNGKLDAYNSQEKTWGYDDSKDMFHDANNNDYVDESERDWDGDGDIDDIDKKQWIDWVDFPVDEGFKHYRDFYGVGPHNPYTYNRDHWHSDNKVTTTAKFDLTSQFNMNNKVGAGVEFKGYDLFNHDPPDRYGYAENYSVSPWDLSIYANDKMEFPGLIVNIGLRWEWFNPNQDYPGDVTDPTWTSDDFDDWDGDGVPQYYNDLEAAAENSSYLYKLRDLKNPKSGERRARFAPRLGVSYPITVRDMLYFNYGRYYQRPRLDYLFRNITYNMGGGFPIVGDPNLEPELTTAYEVGVRHEFNNKMMVEAKGFYKDIFGLTDTKAIYWTVSDWYTTYINADYGSVRGFELSLIKRPPGLFFGELNYTYSIAKGKSSGSGQGYTTEWSGNIIPTFESFLDWDQTHTLSSSVNMQVQGFLTSLVLTAGSGTRYTLPGQGRLIVENEGILPSTSNADLRFSYRYKLGKSNAQIFMLISNLFDRTNINGVADVEWYHTYRTLAETYEAGDLTFDEYLAQTDSDNDGKVDYNKSHPEMGSDLNPAVYGDKRRFQIGISVGW